MFASVHVAHTTPRTDVCKQWHDRLGHPSVNVLRLVLNKIGLSCPLNDLSFCDACKVGKLSQLPFSRHDITATAPLELVYADLWGPTPVLSTEGFRYYVIFVNAFSHYTWFYPLKLKSDALSVFMIFHKFAEIQYKTKLCALQTDNGWEFKSFIPYLQTHGIRPRFTCPHSPTKWCCGKKTSSHC